MLRRPRAPRLARLVRSPLLGGLQQAAPTDRRGILVRAEAAGEAKEYLLSAGMVRELADAEVAEARAAQGEVAASRYPQSMRPSV